MKSVEGVLVGSRIPKTSTVTDQSSPYADAGTEGSTCYIVVTKRRLRALLGYFSDARLAVALGYDAPAAAPDGATPAGRRLTVLDVLRSPNWPLVRQELVCSVIVGER